MNDEDEKLEMQMDPRLFMMMQWLKDNDESGLQDLEHANKHHGRMAPDIINGAEYD